MRSTNVLVVLVLVNASANFMVAAGIAADLGVNPSTGVNVQDDVKRQVGPDGGNLDPESSVVQSAIGFGFAAFNFAIGLFQLIFQGPLMFAAFGVPEPLVGLIFAPMYVLVGFDAISAFAGGGRFE
jgi:hypothetical protein